MFRYPKEFLVKYWSNGKSITRLGKKYRVGRMSYGQFFFEPGKEHGETKPFNKGTLWLDPMWKEPDFYQVRYIDYIQDR